MVLLEAYTAPSSSCRSFKLMALIQAHAAPSSSYCSFKVMVLFHTHAILSNSCHSFMLMLRTPSSSCYSFKLMPLFQADATLSSWCHHFKLMLLFLGISTTLHIDFTITWYRLEDCTYNANICDYHRYKHDRKYHKSIGVGGWGLEVLRHPQ